jgi:hypothetical protein
MIISASILFYGMKFAPPLRLDEAGQSQSPLGASS